jgi:hypothetical protein
MRGRPVRDYEIAARERALTGAQLVVNDPNISHVQAAERSGSTRWGVTEAYLLLGHGTAEEIAAVREGRIAMREACDIIRSRRPGDHQRKVLPRRIPTAKDVEGRVAAFRAARLAIQDSLSLPDASKRCCANLRGASEAHLILKHATPEQIAKAEAGELSLQGLATTIRSIVPPEVRKANRKQLRQGEDTMSIARTEAAIWNGLRGALEAISSMPQPTDVISIVRKNAMRGEAVNRNLMTAFTWITEFSDEWTK